jgi:hypothetical protein
VALLEVISFLAALSMLNTYVSHCFLSSAEDVYEPTLFASFAPVRVLVCERLLPSVLGLGCVCGAVSGVIVAFEELLLKVLASGPRCVSFSSNTH